ncbi:MAG: hypothetical protein VXZ96_01660 [Myxococcota bacterium]|nr:hypothetical protein [Myxococcota bacterium]MEC8378996.1 hypothetical protein [Myxococcota bacterium]
MTILPMLMGCINSTVIFKQVEIIGTAIPQTDDTEGTLNLLAYHEQFGSGDLSYPFLEFARTERTSLDFEWTLEIPQTEGEGLAIRAWLDSDEDGNFCTPNGVLEYGGTHVFDQIDWIMEFEVTLNDPCAF